MTASLHAFTPAENPVRSELTAMRSIAEVLEHLPDNEARARVLQWAAEFFEVKPAVTPTVLPPAGAQPGQAGHTDPYLAVGELSSFFDPQQQAGSSQADGKDEFEPADGKDEFEPLDAEPAAAAPASDEGRGVESMVHSFVADFQKLARDWQD